MTPLFRYRAAILIGCTIALLSIMSDTGFARAQARVSFMQTPAGSGGPFVDACGNRLVLSYSYAGDNAPSGRPPHLENIYIRISGRETDPYPGVDDRALDGRALCQPGVPDARMITPLLLRARGTEYGSTVISLASDRHIIFGVASQKKFSRMVDDNPTLNIDQIINLEPGYPTPTNDGVLLDSYVTNYVNIDGYDNFIFNSNRIGLALIITIPPGPPVSVKTVCYRGFYLTMQSQVNAARFLQELTACGRKN